MGASSSSSTPPPHSDSSSSIGEAAEDAPIRRYKVLVVGETQTGKSCVIHRLLTNVFEPEALGHTSQVGLGLKFVEGRDASVCVELWDVPARLMPRLEEQNLLLKDVDGVIIVSDGVNPVTLRDSGQWRRVIAQRWRHEHGLDAIEALLNSEEEITEAFGPLQQLPVLLLVNKSDSPDFSFDEGDVQRAVSGFKCSRGVVASAKTGSGIDLAFRWLVETMVKFRVRLSLLRKKQLIVRGSQRQSIMDDLDYEYDEEDTEADSAANRDTAASSHGPVQTLDLSGIHA